MELHPRAYEVLLSCAKDDLDESALAWVDAGEVQKSYQVTGMLKSG